MDAVVENRSVLFQEVLTHLGEVEKDPTTHELDDELLRRAERNIDAHTPRQTLWQLLSQGEQLLQNLQQDPRPLTRVLQQVVLNIPFDELKAVISVPKLEEGLTSVSVPVQMLILAYLVKASDTPSGAAFVACNPSLTKTLVTVWLSSQSTEVADRALEVLVSLLSVDNTSTATFITDRTGMGEAHGQGLLWQRLFHDAEVYSLLFEWTSLIHSNHDLATKKGLQQATISQGRLFDFIARLAEIDWVAITTSSIPAVENRFKKDGGGSQPYGGLLKYAATDMIDQTDYLMEVLRQDFFLRLLKVVEEQNNKQVNPRLLEAIQNEAGVEQDNREPQNGLHL